MSRDPYRYYRIEARELLDGLSAGVLALAAEPAGGEPVNRLLRMAHTLKGAARVVRQVVTGELAHQFEALLEPFRQADSAVPREVLPQLLQQLDAIRAELEAIYTPAVAAPSPAAPGPASAPATTPVASEAPTPPAPEVERRSSLRFDAVRVELEDMDRLLEDVSAMSVQIERLRRDLASLDDARRQVRLRAESDAAGARVSQPVMVTLDAISQRLSTGIDQSARGLREMQEQIDTLRLLPASNLFASLERAVFDAASALGKEVRLQTQGGAQKLEAHVLAPVAEALLHAMRNAVDHGIETPAERLAAGKPAQGLIELRIERQGGLVLITARDDGRGIDLESVRSRALASGVIDAAAARTLDLPGAIELLLRGGLSTRTQVSEFSGRGIGLDTVRDTASRLKGSLQVSSRPGAGTTLELRVPASLSRLPALLIEAGGERYSIPLISVRQALRIDRAAVTVCADGEVVLIDAEPLPFARLADLLGGTVSELPARFTALVIGSDGARVVVAVDQLLGQLEILLRPLPASLGAVPLFMGSTLDADGDPQLMLDAGGLVAAVSSRRSQPAPVVVRARPKVLVIDDSLTTRMLEQGILEAAGYEVALATSGEEGLSMARRQRYDLYISDIEMPGMSGYDFIAATRADPKLRDTPGILVSSLHSAASKARGAEVGARAYIVKGEFEQGRFLDTVRSLVG